VNTRRAIVVAAIGTTQTIAWASSYYIPAILGAPIASTLQHRTLNGSPPDQTPRS
jgi:hypothetical protein